MGVQVGQRAVKRPLEQEYRPLLPELLLLLSAFSHLRDFRNGL
jgi:hypothetical protein